MNTMSSLISLSSSVRMRKEHFGGILFDKNTGSTIDVDREAFALLSFIKDSGVFDINDLNKVCLNLKDNKHIEIYSAYKMVETLVENKILMVMPQGVLNKNYYDLFKTKEGYNKIKWSTIDDISAPETVHWAVTFECDLNCPDCYIQRYKDKIPTELSTERAFKMIDNIARAEVFQLAIGGGEPFMRQDITDIVEKAYTSGLVVHITTGRYYIDDSTLKKLSGHVKSIQVGIKHIELLCDPENEKDKLFRLIDALNEVGIDVGANLILSTSAIQRFNIIIDKLSSVGFKRLTLLRYKPPESLDQWEKEKPEESLLLRFEERLPQIMNNYPHIKFRTDCGLAFMQRGLPTSQAINSGIRGCVVADRIISVAPDGSVYPCSQLVGDEFYAGNMIEFDFNTAWVSNNVLRKYRNFREEKSFAGGQCGSCKAKIHCGGCRIFALDTIGSDLGCPDPIWHTY